MKKKVYTTRFKVKIASLSLENEKIVDLSLKFGISVSQILKWRELLDNPELVDLYIKNEDNCCSNFNNKDFIFVNVKGDINKI